MKSPRTGKGPAVLSLLLFIGSASMWVRSYSVSDYVGFVSDDGGAHGTVSAIGVSSATGAVSFCTESKTFWRNVPFPQNDQYKYRPTWRHAKNDAGFSTFYPKSGLLGFYISNVESSYDSGSLHVHGVTLPYWMLAVLALALSIRQLIRWARQRNRWREGRCPSCGYDLRASPDRCPECGRMTPTPEKVGGNWR